MPLFSPSAGGVGLAMRPQDLFPRLHKPSHGGDFDSGTNLWCLSHRRAPGFDPLKKLTDDVEELVAKQDSFRPANAQERRCRIADETTRGSPQDVRKVSEDVHKQLHTILGLIRDLEGDGTETPTSPKSASGLDVVEMLEKLIVADLPAQLLSQLDLLEFDARTDVMNVCSALLRPDMPDRIKKQFVEYLRRHTTAFAVLVKGYSSEETALHYGVVLRSCAKHRALTEKFLASGLVPELLKHASHPSIDISSDAFYTLRMMLLEHKDLSAPWLERNYSDFFSSYNTLLQSGDYISQRQAQKLLTDMLLDKVFGKVMLEYVSSEQNLQIHMILLKDRSKVMQVGAFQVFKIFVANPAKPAAVQKILYRNREKLVAVLGSLSTAKPEDEKLCQELRVVADRLNALPPPGASPTNSKLAL
mmetsp:Transcript_62813/g.180693  ORF Transcript_62813/g.180693 Transcript_62813/m.180693 type:complete len:417 (-) Transcript_62813:158-1408(-)